MLTYQPEASEDAPAPEERRLCSRCVGEGYLKALIEREGEAGACFYCTGRDVPTMVIEELGDRVETMIEQHYHVTATEPSSLEYTMMKESDHDWYRDGEPVGDVIQQCAQIEPEPADDIRRVLEERNGDFERAQMGLEGPSFITRTVGRRRYADDASVSHDPKQTQEASGTRAWPLRR